MFKRSSTFFGSVLIALISSAASVCSAAEPTKPLKTIRALLITGGCCHNYAFQSKQLMDGVAKHANVTWTVVHEGGTGTKGEIPLYSNPNWAKPYDVVVHNECFADTTNPDYIRSITAAHKSGTPAMVIHCAMHTYRAWEANDWREFLGVTSRHHEHQSRYVVQPAPTKIAKKHPALKGFPQTWTTPMDELYIVEKLWPNAKALAVSKSEKTGLEQPVVWVNSYHGTRVFGTTFGHSDDTFADPVYLNLLAQGLLWASGNAR